MGYYLNCIELLEQYENETKRPYFVDKTKILEKLIPLVEEGTNNICITRPRRFGKSVMATMVGAFFGKGIDSSFVFDHLNISKNKLYQKHLNQHELIYIDFSKMNPRCKTYDDYIDDIIDLMRDDLHEAFPNVRYRQRASASEDLKRIHQQTGTKFIFVFDEWDYIFHKSFVSDEDRKNFINFLADLTKGRGYISLTYMTGILPIAKYSSGSSINHFKEFSMATDDIFGEYFGFTDEEVDDLFERYLNRTQNANIKRDELQYWYDGYRTPRKSRLYNPRSVVYALERNQIRSYWTSSGPYSEIADYVVNDEIENLKSNIAVLASGEVVPLTIEEYSFTLKTMTTVSQVLSAMVIYGFLNYYQDENGYGVVCVPNKELMDEFTKTIQTAPYHSYMKQLGIESKKMLEATLNGDTKAMVEHLQYVHDTEIPLLSYNNEVELTFIVNLLYLAARDLYRIEREDKAGRGYVDFIFYPKDKKSDCMILELKVDDTPENAIQQIKDRAYALKFKGKLGEQSMYTGRILAVGIAYKKATGKHECKVEELK